MGELFEQLPLWSIVVGIALAIGLVVCLGLSIFNFRRDRQAWAAIAGVFAAALLILCGYITIFSPIGKPKLDVSAPTKHPPCGEVAYVSILVGNNGEGTAKNCVGEILLKELQCEPIKVVWEGETENKDILPHGGSARLYLLIAYTGEVPVIVVPHYPNVTRYWHPSPDYCWRIKPGSYDLVLTVRSENAKPLSELQNRRANPTKSKNRWSKM
jgi:hypothetical protein